MALEVERSRNFLYLRQDGIQVYRTLVREELQALAWDNGGAYELFEEPGSSYWILVLGSTTYFADVGRMMLIKFLKEHPDEP